MTTSNFVTTLIKNIVTCKNDVVIDSCEENILGDSSKHYLSVPSAVTVRGRYFQNDIPFELSFFAKKRMRSQMFDDADVAQLFLNEKFAYEKLLPNIDLISDVKLPRPKFYGASEDFVLLQNLGFEGYRSVDMIAGADLEHTKLVLQRLAHFHASFLKLKLDHADEFALLNKYSSSSFHLQWLDKFSEHFDDAFQPAYEELSSNGMTNVADYIRENGLFTINALKSFLVSRAEDDHLNLCIHGDTKTDNMMFLYEYEDHGKSEYDNSIRKTRQLRIADFKFIDFQTLRQSSILTDIILFLGTSVDTDLIKSDFEQLLKFYFNDFSEACDRMGIATRPTWDSFWREFNRISGYALVALVWYLPVHSNQFTSNMDWSTVDVEDAKRTMRSADRSLYRKKLLVYAETLSKYFMKTQ